jgi:amidase
MSKKIVRLSACELSRQIHCKEISCTEVMQAYLKQIHTFNPLVNAIVSAVDEGKVMREAAAMDRRLAAGEEVGWMAGFPLASKDLTATAGIPTTFGASFLKSNVPTVDSIVVERMKKAGAILIGKTNVPEFGLGSQTYNTVFGSTKNAYDQTKTSGGSSGGAAVSLALRMQPVADGSDLGGSLRNPAAWNNVYGFRPSHGRVPFGPFKESFLDQMTTEGPMGRHVEDIAMLLSIQAGYDSRAPVSMQGSGTQFASETLKTRSFKGCRVGWLGDYNGHVAIDSELLELSSQSLEHFRSLGCIVDEARPNFDMNKLWKAWSILRSFLFANKCRAFYEIDNCRVLMKPEAVWEIELGLRVRAEELYAASEIRSAWFQEMARLFETFDFLILPSSQVFPFSHEVPWPTEIGSRPMDTYHRWMEIVVGPSMAGLPALSIPAGFNKNGLPFGLQLVGKYADDFGVLQLGYQWEKNTNFSGVLPNLLHDKKP